MAAKIDVNVNAKVNMRDSNSTGTRRQCWRPWKTGTSGRDTCGQGGHERNASATVTHWYQSKEHAKNLESALKTKARMEMATPYTVAKNCDRAAQEWTREAHCPLRASIFSSHFEQACFKSVRPFLEQLKWTEFRWSSSDVLKNTYVTTFYIYNMKYDLRVRCERQAHTWLVCFVKTGIVAYM
jgi:hypothetical protein